MPSTLGTIASAKINAPPPIPTTGLASWWDAADVATITASAGAVSQWNDKSGGNNHLVKNASGPAPTTGTRTINGRNALDFASATLYRPSGYTIGQPMTMFVVAQSDVTVAPNNQMVVNVSGSPTVWVYQNLWSLFAGTIVQSAVTVNTAPHTVSSVFNGASSGMWLDGAAILAGVNPGAGGFTGVLKIGGDVGADNWDGLIGEIIFYNRVLSTPERQQVESYLTNKWMMAGGVIPATGLAGWWDADDATTFSYSPSPSVTEWRDKSGGARHFGQNAGPTCPTRNATINGRSAVRFTRANSQVVNALNFTSAFTAGELFAVPRNVTEDGDGFLGYWGASGAQHYPYVDQQIYEPFGAATRYVLGDPVPNLMVPHIYNVCSGPGSFVAAINGAQIYSSATNTVAFSNATQTVGSGGTAFWNGELAELILYNRVLSTAERQQVQFYLIDKWGLAPTAPISSGLVGWWDAADNASFTYSSGTVVSQWADKSGLGRHLTQATVGKQPTRDGSRNGHPTVTVAAGKNMRHVLASPDFTAGVHLIMAFRKTGANQEYESSPMNIDSPSAPGLAAPLESWTSGINGQNHQWLAPDGKDLSGAIGIWTCTTWSVLSIGATPNGTATEHLNGTPVFAPTTVTAGAWSFTGQQFNLATRPDEGIQYVGDIAEVLAYNRQLTEAERQSVEFYLRAKWRLS